MPGVSPSEPDPEEFERFIGALLEGAPEDYQPWLFRCGKESKAPATEFGSWKDEKNRLTPEEAVEWLEEGGNIGIAGMPEDRLVNVDVDDTEETDPSDLKPTLTARSRSREGLHGFYWAADAEDIPNIPTDDMGEVRAQGQYVVAPGSYVPTDPEDIPEGQEEYAGLYTVEDEREPAEITREELPDVFSKRLTKSQALSDLAERRDERRDKKPDGKSAVFDVTAQDIIVKEGGNSDPSDRWASVFHISKTGENMSFSDGLLHCWRHLVSINGYQALVALSEHPAGCNEVGTPHDTDGDGGEGPSTPSCVFGDDSAIWYAWKYAKEKGYIPEDDPVPYRAIKHICRERELCPPTDLPDGHDPENGETIPRHAYNGAIESIEGYDGLDPGRERVEPEVRANGGVAAEQPSTDSTTFGDGTNALSEKSGADFNPTNCFDEDGRFKAYSFAQSLIESHRQGEKSVFVTDEHTETIYYHNGRNWDSRGERVIRKKTRDIIRDAASAKRVNEVVSNVKAQTYRPRHEILDLPPEKVVLQNGVLDLLNGEFTQDIDLPGTLSWVDVEYDETAYPERFNEFLFEILPKADVSIMWEVIGLCLYRGYPFQRAIMLLGEGANGKSTLLAALRQFLGESNVASVELQTLAKRFGAAGLEGKLANLAPDISDEDLENTSTFKALTGGDEITADRKYKTPVSFENAATMIFSANTAPSAEDTTHAYERRWLYFKFPNTFSEDDPDTVPQRELLSQFENEHAGILNMAAESFRDLWERGGFEATTYMDTHGEDVHERTTRPIVKFVDDQIQPAEGAVLRRKEAYDAYRTWAESGDHPVQGRRQFEDTVRRRLTPEEGTDPTDGRFDVWFDLELVDGGDQGGQTTFSA